MKSSLITLDAKQFICVRDYLIVRLALENGQRPGPMETATVRDFRCAKKGEKGSVMFVARHKTSRGGPAPISMTDELYSKIHTYVKNIRPHIAQKDEDNLFVTQAGVAFPDGTIGKRVVEWWQKAKGRRINSTQIRKMAASTLHEANSVEKRKVHKHMCHSEATADWYYMTGERTRQALESHTILRKNLGLDDENSDGNVMEQPQEREEQHQDLNEENSEEENSEPDTTGLTPEQLDHVDLLFSSEIHSNAKVSIAMVKKIMAESMELFDHVEDQRTVKKVYNRIRYLQKSSYKKTIAAIQTITRENAVTDWISQHDSLPSSGRSTRQGWNADDEEAVRNAFKNFEERPSKQEIKLTFQKDQRLREIMQRRGGFETCYNKVKNIFRKSSN